MLALNIQVRFHCLHAVHIFIHILDYLVSHYFNKTPFLHRQYLAPCEAEVAVSGFQRAQSNPSNYWSGVTMQTTAHVFVGGLPLTYSSSKVRLFQLLDCIGFFLMHDQLKSFMLQFIQQVLTSSDKMLRLFWMRGKLCLCMMQFW